MTKKIFIDGDVGTTGLQIRARLEGRGDITLVRLPENERKDVGARAGALNSVDLAILCLPDEAAREAISLIENPDVRVIDASSAHRVSDGWVYGFAEMNAGQRDLIAKAKRVSNPGCYAVASIAILSPLVAAGLVPADFPLTINAVSGYSGGGKGLIAEFEDDQVETPGAFFAYGLDLTHKHVPEIVKHGGLALRPVFVPSVGHFKQGMIAQLPLQLSALPGAPTPQDIHDVLAAHYAGQQFVGVTDMEAASGMARINPEELNGTNNLALHVFTSEGGTQAVVMALLDNLGKGASGSAVQNMNLMLGFAEDAGL